MASPAGGTRWPGLWVPVGKVGRREAPGGPDLPDRPWRELSLQRRETRRLPRSHRTACLSRMTLKYPEERESHPGKARLALQGPQSWGN